MSFHPRSFLPNHRVTCSILKGARLPRALQFSIPFFNVVAEGALYCAHWTSTVSSCALREQEDDQAPIPSHRDRGRTSTEDHLVRSIIFLLRPLLPLQKGVASSSLTARIEGSPFHRGGSTSKKDGLATPDLTSYRNVAIVTPSPPSARSPARNSAT
jgi:hypothetical protein